MAFLIIPDIHGRPFWREAVKGAGDMPVVFLGDYLDPYPVEGISRSEAWDGLLDIVALKKAQPERITLLLGNHDLAYVQSAIAGSRFDHRNARRNRAFFFEHMDLFDLTHTVATASGKCLLSHAGILPGWIRANTRLLGCGATVEVGARLNELLHDNTRRFATMMALADVAPARCGSDPFGSPVWADVSEHATDGYEIDGVYQIFGHTLLEREIITPYWACLDCGRPFVFDIRTFRCSTLKELPAGGV